MLQNAYFLAKIGADTAENEQHFAEILPKTGKGSPAGSPAASSLCGALNGGTSWATRVRGKKKTRRLLQEILFIRVYRTLSWEIIISLIFANPTKRGTMCKQFETNIITNIWDHVSDVYVEHVERLKMLLEWSWTTEIGLDPAENKPRKSYDTRPCRRSCAETLVQIIGVYAMGRSFAASCAATHVWVCVRLTFLRCSSNALCSFCDFRLLAHRWRCTL